MTIVGSSRVLKRIAGRDEYVPIDPSVVEEVLRGRVLVFEPVADKIANYVCAFPSVDEIMVWYGSFSLEQRERILRRFPGCVIRENMNKI